jgi:hypothetical protein
MPWSWEVVATVPRMSNAGRRYIRAASRVLAFHADRSESSGLQLTGDDNRERFKDLC